MKTLVLILSLFATCISAFAQDQYISLQECNNDTLEYIKANFTGKKIEKYINQPFGKFVDDFELIVCQEEFSVVSIQAPRKIRAMQISYGLNYHSIKKVPMYCLFVEFHEPYPTATGLGEYGDKYRLSRRDATKGYFRDFIIKDMEFVLLYSNGDTSKDKVWHWKDFWF